MDSELNLTHEDINSDVVGAMNDSLKKWKREPPILPIGLSYDPKRYPLALKSALEFVARCDVPQEILREIGISKDGDSCRIEVASIDEFSGDSGILIHRGFADSTNYDEWDNVRQLREEGLVGDINGITYLAPLSDTGVAPNFVLPDDRPRRNPIVIYVNSYILAKWRSVYTDPEQFMEVGTDGKIPKNALIITGGIPAEAIIHITKDK